MAWANPYSLTDAAAWYLAKKIIRCTEGRIRAAIATVPPEMLIARASARLIRHRYSNFENDDNFADDEYEETMNEDEETENFRRNMDMMDFAMVMVQEALEKVQSWLASIPNSVLGVKLALERAFDVYSDVHPKYDKDFSKHLTGLVIKLMVLDSVFIDRDYGDKDKLCVIPFAWEGWVTKLMHILGPFNNLIELRVYGGMYPNIFSAILRGAPNLKSLYISHINITDENLIVASKSCPKLEKFYLLHNFPWQVISMKAFCSTFFRGTSTPDIAVSMLSGDHRNVRISFKSLKKVEIAFGQIRVAKDFHRLLLTYYPELTSYTCEWKTNVFDDLYSTHGREVLIPITHSGKNLAVTKVFLESGVLYSMSPDQLHRFAGSCPKVKSIVLDITSAESMRMCQSEGRLMLELFLEWANVEELHFNLCVDESFNSALLFPTLSTHGSNLKSLILEAASTFQLMSSVSIFWFLELCPNLVHLSIRVWKRSMLHILESGVELKFPDCKHLRKLCFHEDGPGDNDTRPSEDGHRQRWRDVLKALLTASPDLHTLSISHCHGLASVFDDVKCNIEVLHLHVKSCYEWSPSTEQIQALVSYLPKLKSLYLEELRGGTYWKIWKHYRYSELKLYWGNLHGWPRT